MKIINKQIFSMKNLTTKETFYFDEKQVVNFGSRLVFETNKFEYFIEIKGYFPRVISKKDFEQFKKYMEEERNVVWSNDDE